MKPNNLKIHFLGDSITFGQGASEIHKSFVGLFQTKYPDATLRNYGVCGSCVSNKGISTIEDMCVRATRMESDADLIVVFGGTNDFACGVPLGDKTDTNRSTFYGACNALVAILKERYPKAQILLATPIHRKWENLEEKYHAPQQLPLAAYVEAINDCAQRHELHCVNLFSIDAFAPPSSGVISAYTVDGIHPNDWGYQLIFEMMAESIYTLI